MGFLAEHEEVAGVRCLRFMTRARCFIGVGLSALLTLSAVGRAIAADTSLEKRLASATVLQEFNTEGAHIRQVLGAQNLAVLELWKSDSTIVAAYDLNAKQRFRIAGKHLGPVSVSEDGSTLVVAQQVAPEAWMYKVFDSSGALRFEIHRSAFLLPSPSGKYFCNLYDDISKERPTIYDRDGREIRRLEYPRLFWNCRFLDDERLIVANRDTAWFVATASGEVTRVVPLPLNLPYYYDYPSIRVSRSNSAVAIYSERTLVLLSTDGDLLWHESYGYFLSAVAFDDRGAWMALHLMEPKVSGYVEVVSVDNPKRTVTSPPIASLADYYHRGFEVIWFSQGVISIWQPSLALVNALQSDAEYFTLFMEFNADSVSVGQPVVKRGLYWDLGDQGKQTRYLCAQGDSGVVLLSVEANTQEAKK